MGVYKLYANGRTKSRTFVKIIMQRKWIDVSKERGKNCCLQRNDIMSKCIYTSDSIGTECVICPTFWKCLTCHFEFYSVESVATHILSWSVQVKHFNYVAMPNVNWKKIPNEMKWRPKCAGISILYFSDKQVVCCSLRYPCELLLSSNIQSYWIYHHLHIKYNSAKYEMDLPIFRKRLRF